MTPDEAWKRLVAAPVAVLATIEPDGSSHLVPFVFAEAGERTVIATVDDKPKTSRRLRRVSNILHDPRVTVLAHHYESDWSQLWWVRGTGTALIEDVAPPGAEAALAERYPAHHHHELGPWITIVFDFLTGWAAS